jgi:predicted RNase H-like nuclease (RuvC/YqgF family)
MAQRKPTQAELEYGRLRSTAAGLPSTTTKKQLRGTAKKAAVIAATVAGPGKVVKAASKVVKTAKAAKAAGKAKTAKEAQLQAQRAKTVANKAKMDKLASTIKDYETRIANNKEAIKKLDLSPRGTTARAEKAYRDMTQGIKDVEKSLKEAKTQYLVLKNPF